jgi:hypothetical protein
MATAALRRRFLVLLRLRLFLFEILNPEGRGAEG